VDPDNLQSFRPMSNLTFLSKIVERVENDLLPLRQSAYTATIPFHRVGAAGKERKGRVFI